MFAPSLSISQPPSSTPQQNDQESTQSSEQHLQISTQHQPPPHLGVGGLPVAPVLAAAPGEKKRVRSWGEKMVYEAGTCYALGFVGGGLIGVGSGLMKPLPSSHWKLRANSVLNQGSKIGSNYANGFAVFALMYSMGRSTSRWIARKSTLAPGQTYEPAAYTPADDKFEAIGMFVAGTATAFTRMSLLHSVGCGAALGAMMYGGLNARRTFIDEKGIKLKHF